METSLPLFCEEEEEPCRDVNNSLPPVVQRGVDHKGMSHAGRGGGCGEGIKRRSFLCSGRIPLGESVRRVPLRIPFGEFVSRSPVKEFVAEFVFRSPVSRVRGSPMQEFE